MRTPLVLLLLVALPLAAAPAQAHHAHAGCATSLTVFDLIVHVDAHGGGCRGVVVTAANLLCGNDGDGHLHAAGAHVLVADGPGCDTGLILP